MNSRATTGATGWAVLVLAGLAQAQVLSAQEAPLWLQGGDGPPLAVTVNSDRGWSVVDVAAVLQMGWEVEQAGDTVTLTSGEVAVRLVVESPFFMVDGTLIQLADVPYRADSTVMVPVQLFADILPELGGEGFGYDPVTRTATVPTGDGAVLRSGPRPKRVVVVDAGHGGDDPGAVGRSGVREKDIALGVARALQNALASDTMIEVQMIRQTDLRVPVWLRGERATEWKGPRPGVYVSIHANALPGSAVTRGFETYVLSEARTEHERRVVALENAVALSEAEEAPVPNDELGGILTELRNHDHQHWSVLLAELVQEELVQAHTGPSRGVKQGPLAVLTNALMPAVLVELGFVTNRRDERLMATEEFQEAAAQALARSIRRFFVRYPPGDGLAGGS